jgi:hypothetical protein
MIAGVGLVDGVKPQAAARPSVGSTGVSSFSNGLGAIAFRGEHRREDSRLLLPYRPSPGLLHRSNLQVTDQIRQQPYRREDDERRTDDEKYLQVGHRSTSIRYHITAQSSEHIHAITRFAPGLRVGRSGNFGGYVGSLAENGQRTRYNPRPVPRYGLKNA